MLLSFKTHATSLASSPAAIGGTSTRGAASSDRRAEFDEFRKRLGRIVRVGQVGIEFIEDRRQVKDEDQDRRPRRRRSPALRSRRSTGRCRSRSPSPAARSPTSTAMEYPQQRPAVAADQRLRDPDPQQGNHRSEREQHRHGLRRHLHQQRATSARCRAHSTRPAVIDADSCQPGRGRCMSNTAWAPSSRSTFAMPGIGTTPSTTSSRGCTTSTPSSAPTGPTATSAVCNAASCASPTPTRPSPRCSGCVPTCRPTTNGFFTAPSRRAARPDRTGQRVGGRAARVTCCANTARTTTPSTAAATSARRRGRRRAAVDGSASADPHDRARMIDTCHRPRPRGRDLRHRRTRPPHHRPVHRQPAGTIASASVIGPSLTHADAYATAAFVMGEDALRWIEGMADYELLLVTPDGGLLASAGWPTPRELPAF